MITPLRSATTNSFRGLAIAAALMVFAFIPACHSPKGGVMPFTGGSHVYRSTEDKPTTVKLIDTRTGEELFAMDIPVGRELTIDFDESGGDDPVKSPAVMNWQVNNLKTKIGQLRNRQNVPNVYSRRLDVFYRPAPEFAVPPPEMALRVDQPADRPSWWTAEGGPAPTKNGMTSYDN